MTRKWTIVNDNSKANYDVANEITYNYDAYILVRGNITIIGHQVTQIAFKNCAPLTKCTTKIDETTIDHAEDLVIPMYNLIEHGSNYFETTGSLWFYSKDEGTDFNADIANDNNFKSFKCKAKLLGNTEAGNANGILKTTAIAVPLKYISDFWRLLEMPLINCKVELKLKLTKYCVFSAAGANVNGNDDDNIFTIKDTKLYVPVLTLSARDNQKLSKLLSKGFERSAYRNEYKTKKWE